MKTNGPMMTIGCDAVGGPDKAGDCTVWLEIHIDEAAPPKTIPEDWKKL
jgi:hypothetical protein